MNIYIYYIYAYLREDGTPYYIGKGKYNRRFAKHKGISVPKDKSRNVLMETNLSDIGAIALERRYICWYGRKDNGTGILRNLTDGGEGTSGYKRSPEQCKANGDRKRGIKRGPQSPEHKQKRIESRARSKRLMVEWIDSLFVFLIFVSIYNFMHVSRSK
jgi:hypothetical protein